MRLRLPLAALALALALAALALPAGALAAGAPAWALSVTPEPSAFAPGGAGEFLVEATNVGAAPTAGPAVIEAELSPSLGFTGAGVENSTPGGDGLCSFAAGVIRCETSTPVGSGRHLVAQVTVSVPPGPPAPASLAATVSGGAEARAATATAPVQSAPLGFGILEPGLAAPLTEPDGAPAALAGSHPYQQTVSFALPTQRAGNQMTNSGHLRDALLELPPGLIGDPTATPVLCTEAELQAEQCPPGSQLGIFEIATVLAEAGHIGYADSPLYNMVAPPGHPAELAADVAGAGIYAHLFASVRSEGDYGIEVSTPDVIALPSQPIFGVQVQVWGDPSAAAHAQIRGACFSQGGSCPLLGQSTALWTLPGRCGGPAPTTSLAADSWEQPGVFARSPYPAADLAGTPVSLTGCAELPFAPAIEAQPTTNLADSPSGLDVDLHQPQDTGLAGRSSAELRDARVTLPAGMAVNPSQADGLGACSKAEIGWLGASHYSKAPQSCPEAAKLGTVEVTTPLLAQYNSQGTEAVLDPETGKPIPRPLHGSVYLAEPFENQFGSLLAIYLAVEDPRSGTVAKLAGRVEADPLSGRLTTVFAENPQLPIEDIRLHLFGGARGSLITPLTCGPHTTAADLTPWSSPEGADAHPESSFQTTAEPGGGACPTAEAAAANAPAFDAGTLAPQAGAFSPFVLRLSREDGSQRLAGLDTTLPPGLSGKLAGVAECPAAAIARAESRSQPEEGALEREDPSCPASSQLGSVVAAAGAGPTPFHASGHAYLAGPYKGAPLSLVTITPAIAGPFDLGTVVIRVALQVDPVTTQIHAVSDPFPRILDGIPLDLRSVALRLDRPGFTLNPTSCEPMAIAGLATSSLGQGAALASPFQVGGCPALAFEPKLAIRLKGATKRSGNPALRATLTMPPGGAGVAAASVALPHSEFLDQGHIRTVCTRVQFAASGGNGAGCPAGSVYGEARAFTPLLDSPLQGPVYLRSSDHLLPDLVVALHGQIDVDLVGRIDSHKGGIRTTFEGVPDAPVSKFVLAMQGGKKGLLENSTDLCRSPDRATALFDGQNGKSSGSEPLLKVKCPKAKNKHRKRDRRHAGAGRGGKR